MTIKTYQYGESKDRINYLLTNSFLKKLEEDGIEYHVGIDWGEYGKDETAIVYHTVDEAGKISYVGSKLIGHFEENTTKID